MIEIWVVGIRYKSGEEMVTSFGPDESKARKYYNKMSDLSDPENKFSVHIWDICEKSDSKKKRGS